MDVVGVRELKNQLSLYLRRVRHGGGFLVSRRGEIVAEVRAPYGPPGPSDLDPGLLLMADRGSITPGGPNDPDSYPKLEPLLPGSTTAQLLDAERGDR